MTTTDIAANHNATDYRWKIIRDDGKDSSASVFIPDTGKMLVATQESSNFAAILAALKKGVDRKKIIALFDIGVALTEKFSQVTERVSFLGGCMYMDGDPVNSVLADMAVKFFHTGADDYLALVNFAEKAETNPNDHSRTQMFNWLRRHNFSLTPDGDIIAYKGVSKTTGRDANDEYLSGNSGSAIVNGVWYKNQRIPTAPGTIVEMPRSAVENNPQVGCASGLHAANWRYAQNFDGNVIVLVQINPRDVVSVPTESSEEKMRVCRYKVLREVTKEQVDVVYLTQDLGTLFTERVKKVLMPKKASKKPLSKEPATGVVVSKKQAGKPIITQSAPKKKAITSFEAVKSQAKVTKAAPKTNKKPKLPRYFEDFTYEDFLTLPFGNLAWLAKEWDVKVRVRSKENIVAALVAAGKRRRAQRISAPELKIKLTGILK